MRRSLKVNPVTFIGKGFEKSMCKCIGEHTLAHQAVENLFLFNENYSSRAMSIDLFQMRCVD